MSSEANLRLWLRLLGTAKTIEKRLQRGFAEQGTTLPRFDVLATLDHAGEPMAMGELSRALLVSNGNVTGIVKALAKDGLVAIGPLESDRRVSMVSLTAKGRTVFAELAAEHRRWVDYLLGNLGTAARDRLHADLGLLKSQLAERNAA